MLYVAHNKSFTWVLFAVVSTDFSSFCVLVVSVLNYEK